MLLEMHNVPYILDDEEINIGKGIFKGEGGGRGQNLEFSPKILVRPAFITRMN